MSSSSNAKESQLALWKFPPNGSQSNSVELKILSLSLVKFLNHQVKRLQNVQLKRPPSNSITNQMTSNMWLLLNVTLIISTSLAVSNTRYRRRKPPYSLQ